MALGAGTRLGPYEIVALIGAGGMGEVYRAKDPKLNRDVALKVLPEALASDPDRLARFRREAQVLASLNHPNIAHLYGFEEPPAPAVAPGAAVHALVMELVEGPTVAESLARRPATNAALPVDDVVRIARQIADALEAAHEQGIVHRDLKPANIKIRVDGTVKVLDFGLAKALEPSSATNLDAMSSPTLTARATQLGMILGTAAYMAPEQAKGRIVDRRADIWAFGVVLYEMLTGRRAFEAEDVPETLAAVLSRQIDWTVLPADVPPRLRNLLQDCLVRDPKQRLRDIGDARIVLDRILSGAPDSSIAPAPATVAAPHQHVPLWVAGVVVAAALASVGTWALVHKAQPPAQPVRFSIVPSQAVLRAFPDSAVAISPDDARVVYVAPGGSLVVRQIDRIEEEALPGTTGARAPFFSPDGKRIGFVSQATNEIRWVSITGGPSVLVCKLKAPARGAAWAPDDAIFFSTANNGLFRASLSGGEPQEITKPDSAHGEFGHHFPSVLPGGNAIVFTITGEASAGERVGNGDRIAVLDLKTRNTKTLIRGGRQAQYVSPGYLVYAVAGTLRAIRFDLDRLEVQGESVPVVTQVGTTTLGVAQFGVSRHGGLVYMPSVAAFSPEKSLVWFDRQGHEQPIKAPLRSYYALRLSPDDKQLALDIRGQENGIWVWNLQRETLTPIPGADYFPVWTLDSKRIVYTSIRGEVSANLFWQFADGTGVPERLTTADHVQFPMSFTPPDGASLLVKEQNQDTNDDISIMSMTGNRQVVRLIGTTSNERNAEVSPDGHSIAYESDDSNQLQIYIQPFPQVNSGGRAPVSPMGGSKPVWSPSGHELFYYNENALYSVQVQTTPAFSAGKPVKLFDLRASAPPVSGRFYDVSHDGQHFVVIKDVPTANQPAAEALSLTVVLNWAEELKAKVGPVRQ